MKNKKLFFATSVIFLCALNALIAQINYQNTVTGRVYDDETKTPIANAGVYLSGTTIGILTNSKGNFEISKIPSGKYVIVISLIGYKTLTQNILLKDSSILKKDFYLEQRPIEMNPVQVTAEHSSEWKENLEVFKKYFLGQTDLANKCTIENQDEIVLNKNESGVIEAKCPDPISIKNHALGYKIECQLVQFHYNNSNGEANILYYPKFSEMQAANENELRNWEENRKAVYINSMRYFFQSLIKMNIDENMFTVYKRRQYNVYAPLFKDLMDPQNLSRYIEYQEVTKSYVLTFTDYFYVYNRETGKRSWIHLPFGSAEIDEYGDPVDPLMIQVIGGFANDGMANLLPKFYQSK